MVLTASQLRVLRSAMDRVVPADENLGAWEAGCGDFLSRLLEDKVVDAELYRSGLDCLEAESQSAFHTGFGDLAAGDQDDLLSAVEVGSVTTSWSVLPSMFFRTLVKHTMEGYYGSPDNGGNRGTESWRMIGFEVTG